MTLAQDRINGGKTIVGLVDDHPIVRQGLAQLINAQPHFTVGLEASAAPEALALLSDRRVDLLLVDLSLREGSGIDLVRDVSARWPALPILVLSMHEEQLYAERVLRAGAMGYVMKSEPQEKVMAGIRRVLQGETYLSEKMAAKLLRTFSRNHADDATPLERLSDRELQIFRMIGEGRVVKDIAEALFLSPKTVETHKEHIKQKLNLESSNDLLRYAIEARVSEKR